MAPAVTDPDKRERELQIAQRRALSMALKTLTQYPEWEIYRSEMEQMEARYMERMLGGSSEEFKEIKGFIMGLRAAWQLPQKASDSLQNT